MVDLAKQAAKPFLLSAVIVAAFSFGLGIYADHLGIESAPDYREVLGLK